MLYTVCKRIPRSKNDPVGVARGGGGGVSFYYHYINLDLVRVVSGIGDPWGRVSYCNDHNTSKLTQSMKSNSKTADDQAFRQPMH